MATAVTTTTTNSSATASRSKLLSMDTVLNELRVTVRYFAAAAEAAGRQEEDLGFPHGSTLGDLKHKLEQQYGEPMSRVLRSGSFLVDKVVRRDAGHPLSDRVDVLPPFAGG